MGEVRVSPFCLLTILKLKGDKFYLRVNYDKVNLRHERNKTFSYDAGRENS